MFSLNAVIEGVSAKGWRRLTRGGGGVKQMLTIADEGGKGGQAIADDCWRGEEGGLKTPEIGWRNIWTAPYVL